MCLLLKRGAELSSVNAAEEDALSIAINNANADIVTLWVCPALWRLCDFLPYLEMSFPRVTF